MISAKKVSLFCGTGGVGKTTLSAGYALSLTQKNLKVLLITIDPSKRLKQLLNLHEVNGVMSQVDTTFLNSQNQGELWAMCMESQTTLQKMAERTGKVSQFQNSILKNLTSKYSGLNEILSLIELNEKLKSEQFDCIILDTPPGKHFIDFLESAHKIHQFFDNSFIEIFDYLNQNATVSPSKLFFKKIVQSGLTKLLSYLEKVTAPEFVTEFIEAIAILYQSKNEFLAALVLGEKLKDAEFSNWFLVSSVEQDKIEEMLQLKEKATPFMHSDQYFLLNKCLAGKIEDWNPLEPELIALKASILKKEDEIEKFSKANFLNTIKIDEVVAIDFKLNEKKHEDLKVIAEQFLRL